MGQDLYSRILSSLLLMAIGLAPLMGCGSKEPAPVAKTVSELASGELIRQMNAQQDQQKAEQRAAQKAALNDLNDTSALKQEPLKKGTFTTTSAGYVDLATFSGPLAFLAVGTTPCLAENPEVDPAAANLETRAQASIQKLMTCMARLGDRQALIERTIRHFMNFDDAHGSPYSLRTMEELSTALTESDPDPSEVFADASKKALFREVRVKFTDSDLTELRALLVRRASEVAFLAREVLSIVHYRPLLFKHFVSHSRIAALIALEQVTNDSTVTPLKTANALRDALTPFGFKFIPDLTRYTSFSILTPWIYVYLLPEVMNGDFMDLVVKDNRDQPFKVLASHQNDLLGPQSFIDATFDTFKKFRNQDNPKSSILSESPPASLVFNPITVKVAFLDTGIDYIQYPQLGMFLGNGKGGHLGQIDFSDLDNNPWAPYFGSLNHGSGTMGTFLTLMSQLSPDLLSLRQVELASWKVFSLRSFLAGAPYTNLSHTDARISFTIPQAIVNRVDTLKVNPHPDIVSMSLAGEVIEKFMKMDRIDILKSATWLWVMAAGNEGENIEVQKNSCFSDVPEEDRLDKNILCVGAIVRTSEEDRIAVYSNYGDRVDLYAYETYDERCPNGTSCSTPAITTAAAILKGKYPALTPALIKSALLAASQERTMPVDGLLRLRADGTAEDRQTRKIRFFDPLTMMPRALAEAKKLADTLASSQSAVVQASLHSGTSVNSNSPAHPPTGSLPPAGGKPSAPSASSRALHH